jgi:LysR family cyn operon transcriptional activator
MELRHLRYFAALAEKLNFTEAAEQVHVTQPTLSHQIKQLESELDNTLFDRSERRVRLTSAGELFLPKVLEALKIIDSGTALLKEPHSTYSGHIRLATSQTFNIAIVPRAVSLYKQMHPEVRITIEEFTLEEMTKGLREGAIDMAIAYQPVVGDDLQFVPLCSEELVLITRSDHPLANNRRVRMIELHRRELVLLPPRFMTRQLIQAAFETAGTEPKVTIESGTIPSLLTLVQETGAPTILSRYAVPPDSKLRTVPLESPRPVRTTGLIWAKDKPRPPMEVLFAALLRQTTDSYLSR